MNRAQSDVVQSLAHLIAVPSLTRSLDEKKLFQDVAKTLCDLYSEHPDSPVKIIQETDETSGVFHGGIVCKITVDPSLPTVALMGHLDVVPVEETKWSTPPFEAHEQDGKLYGRGSSDMKGGVAVMLELYKKALTQHPNKNITFIFTTGEELGTPNGLTLLRDRGHLEGIDFAIALEPTGGNIDISVAGYSSVLLEFETREAAAKCIQYVEEGNNPTPQIDTHIIALRDTFHGAQIHCYRMSGGEASNTTPANAQLKIGIQLGKYEEDPKIVDTLSRLAESFGGSVQDFERGEENETLFTLSFTSKPYHNSLAKGKGKNALSKASDFLTFLKNTSPAYPAHSLRNILSSEGEKVEEALSVFKSENSETGVAQVYYNYRPLGVTSREEVERKFQEIGAVFSARALKVIDFDTGGNPVDIDNPFLQDFVQSMESEVSYIMAPYWTDIATTSAYGIPSTNFTTLATDQAHQTDEHIEIVELERTLEIFKKYLGLH